MDSKEMPLRDSWAQVATKDEDETRKKHKGFMKYIRRKENIHAVKKEESKAAKPKHKKEKVMKIIEDKEKQIQELKDENETLKENVQIQKESILHMDEKSKSATDLLQIKMDELDKQVAELKQAYEGEVSKSQVQMKQICDLQREREELLNRFSQFAGDRLRHENTDISDLADVDRPTKLGEAYSELYDNEWTDAFEELRNNGLPENDAVEKLLDMLLVSFHNCRQFTWDRYQTLKSIASTITINYIRPYEAECSEPHTCTTTLTTDQEKQVKHIWRTTTNALKDETVKLLYTVISTSFDLSIKSPASTSKYLTSCIDLCWKMGVQEKPLHLDTVAEKNDSSGKIFDLDKFKAFTQAGERVAFLVWPALFLHEGGPILVRGIAQGCTNLTSETN